MKFFKCAHCGNIITYAVDMGVKVVCCGDEMQELVPGTVDAAREKHIPVILREGSAVQVLGDKAADAKAAAPAAQVAE